MLPFEPEGNILYSEKVLGGYAVITKNNGDATNQMNIEILFNAIHQNKAIIEILNHEAGN